MLRLIRLIPVFMMVSLWASPLIAGDNLRAQYGITEASRVILHQPLTISTGNHQAFIQGGETIGGGLFSGGQSYNQYYPFCFFELRSSLDVALTISPDEFEIIRVAADETEFVQAKPVRVVSRLQQAYAPSTVAQFLILELRSESQPKVEKLVCADGFADANEVVMPTLEQINSTLGRVATLKLAQ